MENKKNISVSPAGEEFVLPPEQDYQKEYERIKNLVELARKDNKEIVVVMGIGRPWQYADRRS